MDVRGRVAVRVQELRLRKKVDRKMAGRVNFKDLLVRDDGVMDEFKRKPWDAVTVSAWIPAKLCTKLDLLAVRLRLTRSEALGLFLAVVLQSNGLVNDVERLLMYQSRVNEAFQIARVDSRLLESSDPGEARGLPPEKKGKRKSKK